MMATDTAVTQPRRAHAPEEHPTRQPVRVCFLIDDLAPAGTESQLLALLRHLDRSRVQPTLCLLRGTGAVSRALEPTDCPVIRLGVRSLHHPATLARAWEFVRFLRREQIEILQVYFPDSSYFGVPLARLAGVPTVVRTRNNIGHWLTPLHRWLGRFLNPLTTITVANCEAARTALLQSEKPDPERVLVLENGVDLDRFTGIAPLTADRPLRRVGLVANLRAVKGLDLMVEALARLVPRHPALQVVIAGEGEERGRLLAQAEALGVAAHLTLAGSLREIPAFLGSIDVAVCSSRAEGMSNAVLEYMAAGRAIVATAVGANPRLLEHGVHGLLVPPEDPVALASALDRLLNQPTEAVRLARMAHQRVVAHYSRAAMIQRFETFYLQLSRGGIAC